MNVMVCSSKQFFPYLNVMLASLYENNVNSSITVYIFHSELESADMAYLALQAEKYGNAVKEIFIGSEQISSLPTRQQWPIVLYYRLMLTEMLPSTVDKILSLDVDIIVRKSLNDLYETNLDDRYIAACEDAINTARYKKRIGMSVADTYYNAGVILFNLKKLREDGIGIGTFLQVAQDQGNQLAIPDQDMLNLVLSSKSAALDAALYNCTPEKFEQMFGSKLAQSERFASIIHYLRADCKPWNTYVASSGSELEDLWWDYARKTEYYSQLQDDFQNRITGSLIKENLALKTYYGIALKWLQVENRVERLEQYLRSRNIRSVAIYGLNTFQEILCRDLEESEIHVRYLIDSYAKGYAYGYEIKSGSHVNDIDAVIVAASAHFRAIRPKFDDDFTVISLDELITGIYLL